jgi:prepilin-type N-terminal cleavage/methylation domain-containing protein
MAVKRGFTLIEILVVIAIIGILISVAGATLTTSQKRGRDAKRRADLLAVQKSLEQCYSFNGSYPNSGAVVSGQALNCGGKTTMNLIPSDPKNNGSYIYTYSVNGSLASYCYCALLEQAGTGNASAAGSGGNCSYGGSKNYQCLGSQQ